MTSYVLNPGLWRDEIRYGGPGSKSLFSRMWYKAKNKIRYEYFGKLLIMFMLYNYIPL